MTKQEMTDLWSQYFASPFPEESYYFRRRYPHPIIQVGFKTLARKMNTTTFSTLGDAARFASGVMKSEFQIQESQTGPAPLVREVAR